MSLSLPSVARAADAAHTRWIILAVILLADIVDLLDATITNIAAPTIAAGLGGGPSLVQWLGASYALSMGVLLVLGGRLGDKFGRRRLFLVGFAGFVLASVACGLATSPTSIIIARLAQGGFGALLIPQGFGILGAVFPREQLGQAFSAFGPVMGLAAVGGPILAGALIDADIAGLGWRAAFLINLVIGSVAFVAAWAVLPHDQGERGVRIDLMGVVLLGGATLAVLFSLIEGASMGWSAIDLAIGAVGLVLFALFWRSQQTARNPLLQPSLFRNRGFTAGLVIGIAYFAGITGLMLVIGLFVQYGLGYTPFGAALTLAPVAVGIAVSSLVASRFIARFGRALVFIGMLATLAGIAGLFVLLLSPDVASRVGILPLFVVGLGAGAAFGAIFTVALGDIATDEAGSASGSLSAIQQLATAAGTAAVTTVYFHTVPQGGPIAGARASLLLVAATIALACGLIWLMPRHTQENGV
jgi:EmrB/QacA subfamily drug resistance transporter